MTCLSETALLRAPSRLPLNHPWLAIWDRWRGAWRAGRYLASLDERALRDLGLQRDLLAPPGPRDAAELWQQLPPPV